MRRYVIPLAVPQHVASASVDGSDLPDTLGSTKGCRVASKERAQPTRDVRTGRVTSTSRTQLGAPDARTRRSTSAPRDFTVLRRRNPGNGFTHGLENQMSDLGRGPEVGTKVRPRRVRG